MTNEELITLLRKCATEAAACKTCELDSNPDCSDYLMKQAAEAIEELSAFKAQITDGFLYGMKDGVLYKAKVEMPKGKTIQLPLIEFAEPPKEKT